LERLQILTFPDINKSPSEDSKAFPQRVEVFCNCPLQQFLASLWHLHCWAPSESTLDCINALQWILSSYDSLIHRWKHKLCTRTKK